MSLPQNSFRAKRYFRSKFKEGKYLLSSEASDLELEMHDLIREFIKNSHGNVAFGNGFQPFLQSSNIIVVRPGAAWHEGIPYLLKSGSDAKVIAGILPTGAALTEQNATTSDVGGKRLTFTGSLADNSYSIVVEATEELVKPSGSGAVDSFLEGVNVGEETENKCRLIYKLHLIPTAQLTQTPTFPLSGSNNFVNRIVVTPQTGTANFLISSTPITQDVNGADIRIVLDNSNSKLPFSTDAADYINGMFVDSDGNEMTITSITTDDAGATVKILLDREVNYNSSTPKSDVPVITNLVPYKLYKRDFYVSDNTGIPLGRHFYNIASFTTTSGVISALVDNRTVAETNSFGADLNIRLSGGGTLGFDTGTNNLTTTGILSVTIPSQVGIANIAAGTFNLPSDGSVGYIMLQRGATTNYTPSMIIATKATMPKNVDAYVVVERKGARIYFPDNGSMGNGDTGNLGAFGGTAAVSTLDVGEINNLALDLTSGVLTVTAADATTLSPTNYGYVNMMASNSNQIKKIKITAPFSLADAGTVGSPLIAYAFGNSAGNGVGWSNIPFFIYMANKNNTDADATSSTSSLFISRLPNLSRTPNSAPFVGSNTVAPPTNDPRSIIYLKNISSLNLNSYLNLRCVLVGVVYLSMASNLNMTFQSSDLNGFGQGNIDRMLAQTFAYPAGVNGATAATTHFNGNGGTAPIFSSRTYQYKIQRNGTFTCFVNFGTLGTVGSGLQGTILTYPINSITSNPGVMGGGMIWEQSQKFQVTMENGFMFVPTVSGTALQNQLDFYSNSDFTPTGSTWLVYLNPVFIVDPA